MHQQVFHSIKIPQRLPRETEGLRIARTDKIKAMAIVAIVRACDLMMEISNFLGCFLRPQTFSQFLGSIPHNFTLLIDHERTQIYPKSCIKGADVRHLTEIRGGHRNRFGLSLVNSN